MLLSLEIIKSKTSKIFYIFALQIFVLFISYQSASAKQSLTLVWNISNSNEYFVGRKNVLDLIHKNFKDTNIISIVGPAGIGKTQIAKKYTEIYKKEYDIVWWIDADKSKNIDEQFKKLAEAINNLELDNNNKINTFSSLDEIVNQTKEMLRTKSLKWLLVFDNSFDMASIKRYLPEKQNLKSDGNIMITSKNPLEWHKIETINSFTRKESIELLVKITNINDVTGANELAETLKDFPLALVQAATYIKLHPTISFEEYKESFLSNRAKLWEVENKAVTKHSAFDNYDFTVFTTLSMIIKELENYTKHSLDLLALCSFVHNKNIPKSLFIQYLNDIGITNRLEQEEIIAVLLKYSLIQPNVLKGNYSNLNFNKDFTKGLYNTFTIHEIIQLAIQDYLNINQKHKYITNTLHSIIKFLPDKLCFYIPMIDETDNLLNHINNTISNASKYNIINDNLIILKIRELEYFLSGKRDFATSKDLIAKIEEDFREINPSEISIIRFNIMKGLYKAWSALAYKEAILEFKKALYIVKQYNQKYFEEKLMIYNGLIQSYAFSGDRNSALTFVSLGERLIHESKEFIGNKDTFYHSLAKIYMDNEQFDLALKYNRKSIKNLIRAKNTVLLGDLPFYILQSELLIRTDQRTKAFDRTNFLYRITKDILGDSDHISMARIMILYGYSIIITDNNNSKKLIGIKMIQEAQDMLKRILGGKYNSSSIQALSHIFLGDIYHGSQKYAESLAEYNIAEEILNNYYGYGNLLSSDASDLYSKLAILYIKLEDIDSAQKYLSKLQKDFGYQNPKTIKVINYFLENKIPVGFN